MLLLIPKRTVALMLIPNIITRNLIGRLGRSIDYTGLSKALKCVVSFVYGFMKPNIFGAEICNIGFTCLFI